MSIDRMRVAAVNLLLEKGYKFADGQWVAPEAAVPLTPAPSATRSHADGVDYALRYDGVFFDEFKTFCRTAANDPESPSNWLAGKWAHYGDRMIRIVVDCVRRNYP